MATFFAAVVEASGARADATSEVWGKEAAGSGGGAEGVAATGRLVAGAPPACTAQVGAAAGAPTGMLSSTARPARKPRPSSGNALARTPFLVAVAENMTHDKSRDMLCSAMTKCLY